MKTLIAAFACLATFASTSMAGESYDKITMKELKKEIAAKNVTAIDVNGTKTYNKGHIPTAIDYVEHKDNLAAQLPEDKDALVVAYCGSPSCNAYKMAAKDAVKLGYTNVKHFEPGISGWMQAGEKTENGKMADKKEADKKG